MNECLISIIIPVYNGEKYIDSCITNTLRQTYKNIEIIIVNDGSTDSTKELLKKYYSNKKIKIYNNENHGVSYSRNFGINKATGKYIMFLDIDDILNEKAIELLVDIVKNDTNIDIVRFNGYEELKDSSLKVLDSINHYNQNNLSKEDVLDMFITGTRPIRGYSWLLFIKNKDIIPFINKLKYLEDTVFCIENFTNNKNIYFYDKPLYIYKYNNSSVTKNPKKIIHNLYCILDSYNEIIKIIDDFDIEYKLKTKSWFASLMIRRICIMSRVLKYKEFKKICNDVYNERQIKEFIFDNKNIIRDKKLLIQLKLLSIKLYIMIFIINIIKRK